MGREEERNQVTLDERTAKLFSTGMQSFSPGNRAASSCFLSIASAGLLWLANGVRAAETETPPDLSEFKTVETAQTTSLKPVVENSVGQSGFLGVEVEVNTEGKLAVIGVAENSPAQTAGLKTGDHLRFVDKAQVSTPDKFRSAIFAHVPGDTVTLEGERGGESLKIEATLSSPSRPKKLAEHRAVLGVNMAPTESDEGVAIRQVGTGTPAADAGLKPGDVLLKVNDASLGIALALNDALADKEPGEMVMLTYRRDGVEAQMQVKLGASQADDPRNNAPAPLPYWKKNTYRLAVVPIAFTDVKGSETVPLQEWDDMLFSSGVYQGKNNATGQPVYGSLHDYYQEVSVGALDVSGHVYDWVTASKTRAEYPQLPTNPKLALFTEVLDALLKREGKDCLAGVDGLVFIYAGDRFKTTNRGSVFWPHRASVMYRGKSWPYVICPEGRPRMANISVFCHEFGHLLGLPDLYARPENPGSEGVGAWSLMSQQLGGGQPQHMCAWCKERLGWLKPAIVDPSGETEADSFAGRGDE